MSNRVYPWTSEDLRRVADKMDVITSEVGKDNEEWPSDDWRYGLSVEVLDDMDNVIGYVKAYPDGWLGFYPNEVTD